MTVYNMKSPEEVNNKIKNEYEKGATGAELSKKYGLSVSTILKRVREMGGEVRKCNYHCQKYSFNHNFFEKIDTEAKAYFLGFIMADGCVSDKELIIAIHERDQHILEELIKQINGNNKIHYKEMLCQLPGTHNPTPTARLNICSQKMLSDLSNLGCTKNKTNNIKIPALEKEFERHFWRGFWDGDGHISSFKNGNYLSVESGLIGHINTIRKFNEFLKSKNISCNSITKDKSVYRTRLSGDKSIKCLDILYANSDPRLRLRRKFKKYINTKKQYHAYKDSMQQKFTSKHKYVARNKKGKWVVTCYGNKSRQYIGMFETESEALEARNNYLKKS